MVDVEAVKQIIAQAVVEVVKAVTVAAKEENKRQAMSFGHHNTSETFRSQIGGHSLRQPVFEWNSGENERSEMREQGTYQTVKGLFGTLGEKFKPRHCEIIMAGIPQISKAM